MDRYHHVRSYLFGHVWALHRPKYDEIRELLELRGAGVRLTEDEIKARIGRDRHEAEYGFYDIEADAMFWAMQDGTFKAADGSTMVARQRQTVAVVGIYGTIVPRASLMTDTSGLMSTDRIAARVRAAVADPSVKGVVLDVDSPGGDVAGAPELAADIRALRSEKPIEANASYRALSLGYWYASQALSVSGSPSSLVGGVGVFAEHVDYSEREAKEGVKVTMVASHPNKVLGNPHEKLSPEAVAEMEKHVQGYTGSFEHDVAKGRTVGERRVSVDDVRRTYGRGLMFSAKEALERGMIDRIETLEATIRRVGGRGTAAASSASAEQATPSAEADPSRAAAAALLGSL